METPVNNPKYNRTENERNTDAVAALLTQKLPTNASALQDVLRDTEWRYLGILTARIVAQSELYTKRLQFLHPKDKELTDIDRKIMLDAYTAEHQAAYDKLASIEKALEQRIAVIQTLLVQ